MKRATFVLLTIWLLQSTAFHGQDTTRQQRGAEILILNAGTMEAPYEGMSSDGIRLIKDVRLKHEDVFMFCDSAHRFSSTNTVHAYGNVRINQGDTLNLYGDYIIYQGNIRYAEVIGNVTLVDNETTLKTEILDFDLNNNFGYYPNGGFVVNGDNQLVSDRGYYYTDEKLFFFRDNVVVTNPDYIIKSDTLKYNTLTEIAYFMGPTTIKGDNIDIYCENGWYNTITDIAQFNENARVRNNNQILSGDSIYFDNNIQKGEAFNNIEVIDSVENIIIRGNYAWFRRNPEHMFITNRALLIQMAENDTTYLHADTLRTWLEPKPLKFDSTLSVIDSDNGANDSVRILTAYYGARFLSNDMQGKADSLYYNLSDSTILMFGHPVLWSDGSQLSADFMKLTMQNGEPDKIEMNSSSFVISEEEPGFYNQIKGRDITGFFREGELYLVYVVGNAQTLYFPVDSDGIIGINKANGARLTIYLADSRPERIRLMSNPDGILYPLEEVPEGSRFLPDFQWLDFMRPKTPEEVFNRY